MTHTPKNAIPKFWLWCFATLASAQTSRVAAPDAVQANVKYDVVSIQPAGPSESFSYDRSSPDGNEMILSVRGLVSHAYSTRPELVFGGPKWADKTLFHIKAKVNEVDLPAFSKMPREEKESILRPVLASRFGLKVHSEVRVLAVYDLVLATNKGLGPDFTPHSNKKPNDTIGVSGENFSGFGTGMATFTKVLSHVLLETIGRPILDKTGLTGTYDFILRWRAPDGSSESSANRPDIFSALKEQLGFRLEPAKEPVTVIVIDSVELPSDN